MSDDVPEPLGAVLLDPDLLQEDFPGRGNGGPRKRLWGRGLDGGLSVSLNVKFENRPQSALYPRRDENSSVDYKQLRLLKTLVLRRSTAEEARASLANEGFTFTDGEYQSALKTLSTEGLVQVMLGVGGHQVFEATEAGSLRVTRAFRT